MFRLCLQEMQININLNHPSHESDSIINLLRAGIIVQQHSLYMASIRTRVRFPVPNNTYCAVIRVLHPDMPNNVFKLIKLAICILFSEISILEEFRLQGETPMKNRHCDLGLVRQIFVSAGIKSRQTFPVSGMVIQEKVCVPSGPARETGGKKYSS